MVSKSSRGARSVVRSRAPQSLGGKRTASERQASRVNLEGEVRSCVVLGWSVGESVVVA